VEAAVVDRRTVLVELAAEVVRADCFLKALLLPLNPIL
jgi:hypothetical protein